jgi:hypothetical protein
VKKADGCVNVGAGCGAFNDRPAIVGTPHTAINFLDAGLAHIANQHQENTTHEEEPVRDE